MANRQLQQFTFSTENYPVFVYAQVNFAGSGVPTLAQGSRFISGIVRNSAGDYTLTFRDVWPRLMGVDHVFFSGSSAPASPGMWIKADATATAATRTMEVVFNIAGTATDPASGEKVYLVFKFKNSSV